MQISELSASNTFSATDVLAIEVNVNGVEKTYKLTGATLATALASIGSYLTTADVVNNLTSTATNQPLSANMGKTLNNNIKNLVTKSTYVSTTDADGDTPILNIPAGRVPVFIIPNRNYGDGTYSSWFGVIVGCNLSGVVSIKCVNDNNQSLASQKVAVDVYYIDGQQLGSQ